MRKTLIVTRVCKTAHTDYIRNLSIKLSFAWGMDGDSSIVSKLSNNADTTIDELKNADGIYAVESTGKIIQYRGIFSQAVRVIQVIKSSTSEK